MLSPEDNDYITRVGPGTPMGNLMREYWLPAMLSSELAAPDCDPVRVMLLGEKLIGFRDSDGQVGLVGNHCPHRGASLFFSRNEECGLRCVYHGWKFDVHGNCVDMPNEPPITGSEWLEISSETHTQPPGRRSNFKHKIKHTAYPCRERGGIVWTYMGPRQAPPPLPDLEPNMLPADRIVVQAIQRECNWLQGLEGEIDTSHLAFLHFGTVKAEDTPPGTFQHYLVKDRSPRYAVVDTDYGAMYGAYRPADDGRRYWRIAQFLLPFFSMIPTGVLGLQILARAWVPLDDTHMMFYSMATKDSFTTLRRTDGATAGYEMLPQGTDWYGRFRLAANAGNDYRIDRQKQRSGADWTGISGIHTQDQAITESMGPIYDRGAEHLGSSDVMVIRVRRRLMEVARALQERGATPPGVDDPEVYRQRSGGVFLPQDADWLEATNDLRKAFVEHLELDSALMGRAS